MLLSGWLRFLIPHAHYACRAIQLALSSSLLLHYLARLSLPPSILVDPHLRLPADETAAWLGLTPPRPPAVAAVSAVTGLELVALCVCSLRRAVELRASPSRPAVCGWSHMSLQGPLRADRDEGRGEVEEVEVLGDGPPSHSEGVEGGAAIRRGGGAVSPMAALGERFIRVRGRLRGFMLRHSHQLTLGVCSGLALLDETSGSGEWLGRFEVGLFSAAVLFM